MVAGREFTDRTGVRWRVSEIADAATEDAAPRERRSEARSIQRGVPKAKRLATRPLQLAWLCFESPAERRRVTPVPPRWRHMPDDELEDLLGDSVSVPSE
ncbi:MAG TPA: hypothetical protein VII52_07540 [Gemmatimonadaceae bacterium]